MTPIALPHNLDAERAVIAAALRKPETLEAFGLHPSDFYLATNQQIAAAVLMTRNQAPQGYALMAVLSALQQAGHLENVGGFEGLSAIEDAWLPTHEVEAAAGLVRGLSVRRSVIAAGEKIVTLGYDTAGDLDSQLGDAAQALTDGMARSASGAAVLIGESLPAWFDMVTSDEASGVRYLTGLADLDRLAGGVWSSDLTVLAAATSVGKTALALTIADAISQSGAPVLWFSLEMPREQLINRLVAMHTGLDAHKLRMRKIPPADLPKVSTAMDEISRQALIIDPTPSRTLAQIRTICHQQRARHGNLGLVVIDHLGLVQASARYKGNRVHEVGELSRGSKALGMELEAPVLALHQFNRDGAAERNPDQVPVLSDLRDSGNVEQDADNVWLLHRPNRREAATLYIAKHRNGPIASVALRYDAGTTRFQSAAPAYREASGYGR